MRHTLPSPDHRALPHPGPQSRESTLHLEWHTLPSSTNFECSEASPTWSVLFSHGPQNSTFSWIHEELHNLNPLSLLGSICMVIEATFLFLAFEGWKDSVQGPGCGSPSLSVSQYFLHRPSPVLSVQSSSWHVQPWSGEHLCSSGKIPSVLHVN